MQDGTINYLGLSAITSGLHLLSTYLPLIPLRLNILLHHLIESLGSIRHESAGTPVVRILSRIPSKRLAVVGEQADTGSLVSALFLSVSLLISGTFETILIVHLHDFSPLATCFHCHLSNMPQPRRISRCARDACATLVQQQHFSVSGTSRNSSIME